MEERIHYPNPSSPPPPSSVTATNDKTNEPSPPPQLYHDDKPFNVYVVQFPKEIIYRVPPPENAQIVQSHWKSTVNKKESSRWCSPTLRWIIVALIILALISTAIAIVCKLTLNPNNPKIQVKQLTVQQSGKPQLYTIELEISNPNTASRVVLLDGKASLAFKGHVIAKGSSPTVEQDAKGVDLEEMILKGLRLPKELEKSLKGSSDDGDDYDDENMMGSKKEEVVVRNVVKRKKSKAPNKKLLAFTLEMKMLVMKKTWLTTKKGHVKVKCGFVVSGLESEDAMIQSQKCVYV